MDEEPSAATWSLNEITEGQTFNYERVIHSSDVDAFASLTGDFSPLHMDESFARKRGFKTRVVHGALLGGLISRVIGMHLPGRNAILLALDLKFSSPIFVGDLVRICGTVVQLSIAASSIIIQFKVYNTSIDSKPAAFGKAIVGMTRES